MESYNNKENLNKKNSDELFSSAVRAGKRTYFFDVKATKKNDQYLTITESKKVFNKTNGFSFEKHKIFLYKEDFDKFTNGLLEALEYIKQNQDISKPSKEAKETFDKLDIHKFTKIEFEDLVEL